jgi:uncharacterized protein
MTAVPDYDDVATALAAADVELSPAETHGLITGVVSFQQPPHLAHALFGLGNTPRTPAADHLLEVAQVLAQDIRRRLEETDFEFEPMLGNEALPAQVEGVAAWARGYVLGLAAGGVRDTDQLRGDAGEFLLDTISIGEAELDEDTDPEQQERELVEIIEYLRVGVQLVYEELQQSV